MVLQRAPQRAIVWGYADSFDAPIILTINNKVYRTRTSSAPANSLGEAMWTVTLDAQAEEGPFQVKVTHPLPNGTLATITLSDVLFGDVWICSGQSNMSFQVSRMYNATEEIANAGKFPKVRLFTATRKESDIPQEELLDIALNWSVASPVSVNSSYASAVCWLYGRMIHAELGGRPIGLIHSSYGGTIIEFWSPPDVLRDCDIPQ
jgi:sialate O-acetylesterase